MQNILVCDDDKEIVEAVSIYLKTEGFNVFDSYNGSEALTIIKNNPIDLIIMDIMMPGDDGYKTVMKIREKYTTPVIFLSAKQEDNDKILGLNIGADDFITKPFNPLLLVARVKALLRRDVSSSKVTNANIYSNGDLIVDNEKKIATLDGDALKLTPIEYNILLLFMKNQGKTFTTQEIYQSVWHTDYTEDINNTIAVHIRHLREKIEHDTKDPKHIKVIWGRGYKMEA